MTMLPMKRTAMMTEFLMMMVMMAMMTMMIAIMSIPGEQISES